MKNKELIVSKLEQVINKNGLTPELAMIYLFDHMNKLNASVVGMDLIAGKGKKVTIIVSINDESIENLPPKNNKKYGTPDVI